MKEVKRILFVFVALLLFVGVVDAADYATEPTLVEEAYKNEWKVSVSTKNEEGFVDAVEVEGGTVSVGYSAEEDSCYLGLIQKLDETGKVVWNYTYGNDKCSTGDSYLYKVVKVEDGLVVLGGYEDYTDETKVYYFVAKYDFEGKVKWTKELENLDSFLITSESVNLDTNGEVVVVSLFDLGLVYTIDAEGNISEPFNGLVFPNATIIDNNIYIVGNLDTDVEGAGNLVVKKYDLNFKELSSKTLLTISLNDESNEVEKIYYAATVNNIDNNVVIGAYEYYNGTITMLVVNSNTLEVSKMNMPEFIGYTYDIEETKGGFIVIGDVYEVCQPQSNASLNETKLNEKDSKYASGYCYDYNAVIKYDLSLNEKWRIELPFYGYGLGTTYNGFVVVGEYDYNVDGFTNAGRYDAYTYRYSFDTYKVETKTDGNGEVTSSKVLGLKGEEVEFTITPKEGYTLKKVTVTTSDGNTIEFKDNKFTMPSDDVVIYAEFEKEVANPNTGLNNPYMICGIVLAGAGIGYCFLKKKKYI